MVTDNAVAIWTEGGRRIGMGHFRRCLAVAHQLREDGAQALFMVNDDISLISRLKHTSFSYRVASFDDIDYRNLLRNENGGKILIDTKRPIVDIMRELRGYGYKLVLVDNATEARLESDIAVYPTAIFRRDAMEWGGFRGEVIGGADYVPISSSLVRRRRKKGDDNIGGCGRPYNILVTMGGSDPYNTTCKVVSALTGLPMPVRLKVVIGPCFSCDTDLLEMERQDLPDIEFVRNVPDLASIMAESDIAVTAFGTTIFELAYVGVPSVVVANYRSDKGDMDAFGELGIGVAVGCHSDLAAGDIRNSVVKLLSDRGLLRIMSENGMRLIDGNGARRITSVMLR